MWWGERGERKWMKGNLPQAVWWQGCNAGQGNAGQCNAMDIQCGTMRDDPASLSASASGIMIGHRHYRKWHQATTSHRCQIMPVLLSYEGTVLSAIHVLKTHDYIQASNLAMPNSLFGAKTCFILSEESQSCMRTQDYQGSKYIQDYQGSKYIQD